VIDRIVTSPAERRSAIVDVIRGAKGRLVLSLFRCNDEEIFDELGAAVHRGVDVQVLATSRAKGGRRRIEKLWTALAETGAAVHAYGDPVVKYHAKYLVADDGPAVVASLNFTRKCFTRTCDALVVTDDMEVVAGLQELFAADRDGRPMPEITPRLVIGPERAREQVRALVANARDSIRLIDAKTSDPDVLLLLEQRRRDGLLVEIIGSKRIGGLKSHGKIMLIDGTTAVVGSLGLSALSLEFRREVSIIVDHPAAVADVEQLFGALASATAELGRSDAEHGGPAVC
jgi:phosphatidylserine/phosphatidylglycerophosphate/cardiolipin synthase-like enzyme